MITITHCTFIGRWPEVPLLVAERDSENIGCGICGVIVFPGPNSFMTHHLVIADSPEHATWTAEDGLGVIRHSCGDDDDEISRDLVALLDLALIGA